MRILIIEDDQKLGTKLASFLKNLKFQVNLAENIKDGLYFAKAYHFDLILLQYLSQPTLDFISQSKSHAPKTAIIVLAKSYTKEAELRSLKTGANDFLSHPLDFEILLARIEAHLRFGSAPTIIIGKLSITPSEEYASFRDQALDLKGKPFEILCYLATHQNRIISKEELLDALWEEPRLITPNVIEVAINQIRHKLDKPFQIQSIQTIRKRGYRLNSKTFH